MKGLGIRIEEPVLETLDVAAKAAQRCSEGHATRPRGRSEVDSAEGASELDVAPSLSRNAPQRVR